MSSGLLNGLMIAQIVISVVLTIAVILQNRAEGLGGIFGGGGEIFRTKRGLEKFLYYLSIVLGILLATLSFIIVKYTK